MASVYMTILNSVAQAITNLGFTFGTASTVVPVVVRKLPRAEEGLDTLPLIIVCPQDRPERVTYFDTEGHVEVVYAVQVVVVSAGNRDFTATTLDLPTLQWREKIRRAFQGQLLNGAPTVFFPEIDPQLPLDRAKLNASYDYSGLGLRFHSLEPSTN